MHMPMHNYKIFLGPLAVLVHRLQYGNYTWSLEVQVVLRHAAASFTKSGDISITPFTVSVKSDAGLSTFAKGQRHGE